MRHEMPPIHPAANLFPMLPDDELRALADDIKANGLQQPIVMLGPCLLDGRNRWRACELAGVEVRLRDWSGADPIGYVISVNLRRRHLDESQRSMVAARIATLRRGANQHPSIEGASIPSQDEAASLLNVGVASVERARKVIERGVPELAAAVDSGAVAVSTAALVADKPASEQREIVARGEDEILAKAKEIRAEKQAVRTVERRKRLRIVTLEESVTGRFPVIYADPPWQYSNTGFDGSAEGHYPTMNTDDICAMPVGERATTNAVLLMWATWPLLKDALRVIEAWGFEYKTGAPWKKHVHVGGFYFLGITELLLVGVRGSALPRETPIGFFDFPRTKHSKKPSEMYELIERMYEGPYLELFARNERDNWTAFGNEPLAEKAS